MKSRIVRPVQKYDQKGKKNKKAGARLDQTQPLRPVGTSRTAAGRLSGETQPMRTAEIRAGYAGYRRSVERRREIVQTPRSRAQSRPVKQKRAKRSWFGNLISTKSMGAEDYFDFDLLLVVIFLLGFGLVMLYSTSAYEAEVELGNDLYYFSRQALIGAVGFIIMIFISRIDYHIYGAFAAEIYAVAMVLMVLVKSPLGITLNGARRWIRLPGNLTLQPAEITKIAVILFIAYELCRLGRKAYKMEGVIQVFVFGAIASGGVLFLTDNLSTAIIVMAITCILIFVSHPKMKPFLIFIGVAAVIAVVGIAILAVTAANSDNFRLQRIISWLNPEATADSGSYQVMQGLYAIGSGGFFGKGLGNSTQKLGVIPEAQNDMILVVICEELGVFGAFVIFLLFGILLYRLMFIAQNAPDLYGSLIATGIFAHIALQVTLNIAVVTGMLPTTGITLPFISYGGTAIVFLLAEMGIALGISRRIRLEGE